MKKERIIYIMLIIVVAIAGIIISAVFRGKLVHLDASDQGIDDFYVDSLFLVETDYKTTSEKSVEDYMDGSEVIVIAEASGEREAAQYGTLSGLKVVDILKDTGNKLKPGDTIYVYETHTIEWSWDFWLGDGGGYGMKIWLGGPHNLMRTGREYLLLLDFFKRPDCYEMDEKDERTYVMQDVFFSQYPIKEVKYKYLTKADEGTLWTYADVKDYDMFLYVSEEGAANVEDIYFIRQYKKFREEIFALTNVEEQ